MEKEGFAVLVVDDSALMRRLITDILKKDPGIKSVDYARNGKEALEKIARQKPDVVTLDVEMPGLSGLETLSQIMNSTPLPVVMVSSLTTAGAETTLEALERGALDFIAKPQNPLELSKLADELREKVKVAAKAQPKVGRKKIKSVPLSYVPPLAVKKSQFKVVTIAASTGGPSALQTILESLPPNFPLPLVIVQHMPKGFTAPLAQRLDRISKIKVMEAIDSSLLLPATAYIVAAGYQPFFTVNGQHRLEISEKAPLPTRFFPSADILFLNAAENFGSGTLAVILTGMGNDGVKGLAKVKEKGGYVLAEDEESCVVYGMPRAAVEAGLADEVLPLSKIGKAIIDKI